MPILSILYHLFAESTIQIGVSSTAIFEGLTYGLQTFILDAPGSSYFDRLLETGFVHKVSTVDDLFLKIKEQETKEKKIDEDLFFKSDGINNTIKQIEKIIEKT